MSFRDVLIFFCHCYYSLLLLKDFFYAVVTSPLPPYLNSAALSGLLMVIKEKVNSFAIKVCDEFFLHQKPPDFTLSAMLTVLPDDIDRNASLVCVFH